MRCTSIPLITDPFVVTVPQLLLAPVLLARSTLQGVLPAQSPSLICCARCARLCKDEFAAILYKLVTQIGLLPLFC